MQNLMCLLGRHRGVHHVNPEFSGPGGGYDVCARCRRERTGHNDRGNPSFKGPLVG